MRVFCLVGVPGSGKTTLIRAVMPKLHRFEYIDVGSVIQSLIGDQYPQFGCFPNEVKRRVRSRAIMYMKEESERYKGHMIIEDHVTTYDALARKFERVLPDEASFFYTDLILHSVEPSLVRSRRISDLSVKRGTSLPMIEKEVRTEEAEAHRYADMVGLDLHILKDGGGPEPAHALLRLLRGY